MAKASAEGGATHYVAEGDPVPDDLPPGVRLVGSGAPAPAVPEEQKAEAVPDPPVSTPPAPSPGSSGPGDDEDGPPDYGSYPVAVLRDLARERGLPVAGAKADLVARLAEHDAGPAPGVWP